MKPQELGDSKGIISGSLRPGDIIEVEQSAYNINISFREDESGNIWKSFFHHKGDVLMICKEFHRHKSVMFMLLTKFGVMYATKRYIECYTQKVEL